ncbi:MAG: hypothetical protein U5L45_07535 [Saprospiraceae bacterium]|nr:hypothetical protein [Saprospiraceae bacterium]
MVHFSGFARKMNHIPLSRERSLLTSRVPSGEFVLNNYIFLHYFFK